MTDVSVGKGPGFEIANEECAESAGHHSSRGREKLAQDRASSAANEPPRLRSGLISLPLDDEMVVFCQNDRRLIGLNATASLVFRELQAGTSVQELPRRLAFLRAVPLGDAQEWAETALSVLRSQGLLDGRQPAEVAAEDPPGENRLIALRVSKMPPYTPRKHMIERRYRLLEARALIRFEHPGQVRMVDAVLGHLACDEAFVPTVTFEIQAVPTSNGKHLRSRIYREGEPINSVPRLSHLAPFVKSALWQTAINTYDFRFYIHAGVVGTDKGCILLPASAGSGKSSLTAALTHSGYLYYSDEVALINHQSFRVPPMPLAICTKSTGWDVMLRYYPDLLTLPVHRRDDEKLVRYIPPPPNIAQHPPAPVSHIIFPCYRADVPTRLRPIGRSEALGRLMAECLAAREQIDAARARELVAWISQVACYDLTFSSLSEAVRLISEHIPHRSFQ